MQPVGHEVGVRAGQGRLQLRLVRQLLPVGQVQSTVWRQLSSRRPQPPAQVTAAGRGRQVCRRRTCCRARRRHARRRSGSGSRSQSSIGLWAPASARPSRMAMPPSRPARAARRVLNARVMAPNRLLSMGSSQSGLAMVHFEYGETTRNVHGQELPISGCHQHMEGITTREDRWLGEDPSVGSAVERCRRYDDGCSARQRANSARVASSGG